ncbi:MAG: terpene cyclase/mutase family protein [Anaerolineae bacterium]|nr:terpene cyclase/mutase family protein [Anaerolineae bacterium]
MSTLENPLEILQDPEVRGYLMGILESNLTNEQKYQKLIDCFARIGQVTERMMSHAGELIAGSKEQVQHITSQVGQDMNLHRKVQQTEDAIVRAVRRLSRSQHSDGGWGFQFDVSNFWGTAYAVLCLNAAQELENLAYDVDVAGMLQRGLSWIGSHPEMWAVEYINPGSGMPVYEISLAVRCFYQAGQPRLEAIPPTVSYSIERLVQAQNEDGGWDAQVWGFDVTTPTRCYSEVGATSAALQALGEVRQADYRAIVERAIRWLTATQNADGSWNSGSCHPGQEGLSGSPALNKTCDALQGMLVGQAFEIDLRPLGGRINRAVEWLRGEERPIFDAEGNIEGWGWGHYENTCLTLETLVKMPDAPLPLLSANAQWLLKTQTRQEGDVQDGNWQQWHTARIALSLIAYYQIIKKSSLFDEPQRPADE